MADLRSDNVTIGNFMRELVKDRARCQKMEKDTAYATEQFGTVLELAPGHQIKVHLDQKDVTHVIIPLQEEMAAAEAVIAATGNKNGYPVSYVKDPLADFKASEFPDKAFSFRVGEYTMRRCKG